MYSMQGSNGKQEKTLLFSEMPTSKKNKYDVTKGLSSYEKTRVLEPYTCMKCSNIEMIETSSSFMPSKFVCIECIEKEDAKSSARLQIRSAVHAIKHSSSFLTQGAVAGAKLLLEVRGHPFLRYGISREAVICLSQTESLY